MHGLHLTADLFDCQPQPALLEDAQVLAEHCRRFTREAGLTLVGEKFHSFPGQDARPGGVTGMLLLAESHLAVHTWPDRGGVTLDVFVCNFTTNNSAKAEHLLRQLVAAFQPGEQRVQRIERGLPMTLAASVGK